MLDVPTQTRCEERNFTHAARRCGIAQSWVSSAIRALEREFGGALFDAVSSMRVCTAPGSERHRHCLRPSDSRSACCGHRSSPIAAAPAERCHASLPLGIISGYAHKYADAPHSVRPLRARREWPRRRRSAEQRDELPPLHSITSSARASREGGISSPSALAVLRLMTNSIRVGCSTGNSAGVAPRRIRST